MRLACKIKYVLSIQLVTCLTADVDAHTTTGEMRREKVMK